MNTNCTGCFANDPTHTKGCTALRVRIDEHCPFYKTKEEYAADVEKSKETLHEHRPGLYYIYYGKDGRNADRGTDEKDNRASEKGQ
jgi:Fe-S-cluster containining protein